MRITTVRFIKADYCTRIELGAVHNPNQRIYECCDHADSDEIIARELYEPSVENPGLCLAVDTRKRECQPLVEATQPYCPCCKLCTARSFFMTRAN